MKAYEYIKKTREYLDYLERHIKNVEKSWGVVKEKCSDMRFISDDVFYHHLENDIRWHDTTKFHENEFIQYRKAFYPLEIEDSNYDLSDAWEHHKRHNIHHWEHWTEITTYCFHPDDWEINAAHMVIDWIAMSYELGVTAEEYYEKNKDRIKIPDYAIEFIYEIFKRIYK